MPESVADLARGVRERSRAHIARAITLVESTRPDHRERAQELLLELMPESGSAMHVGITGVPGVGKSTSTNALVEAYRKDGKTVAVLAVDPSSPFSGGALLGDRIRMNSLRSPRVFMRSMATRRQHAATNVVLKDSIGFLKSLGYDLVIVETAGIGQSDSEIVDLVDFPVYVMTSDYGAASQLEKIDMLDFAEVVAINKFDRKGGRDALHRTGGDQDPRDGGETADDAVGRLWLGLSDFMQVDLAERRPNYRLDLWSRR